MIYGWDYWHNGNQRACHRHERSRCFGDVLYARRWGDSALSSVNNLRMSRKCTCATFVCVQNKSILWVLFYMNGPCDYTQKQWHTAPATYVHVPPYLCTRSRVGIIYMRPYSVHFYGSMSFLLISIARSYLMYNNNSPVTDLAEQNITRWAWNRVTRTPIYYAGHEYACGQSKKSTHLM